MKTSFLGTAYPGAAGMLEAGLEDAANPDRPRDVSWYRRILRAAWLVANGIMECGEALDAEKE